MHGTAGRALAGIALATALLASGCSINPAWQLTKAAPDVPPVLVGQVPFHSQTDHQCGPAALAMVLGASGVAITPEALVPQVYLPGREGSLQLELVAATRRAGRIPYVVQASPDALIAQLREGRPVLVLQNLLTRSVPRWHYAVLVGSDQTRNRLILHSGTRKGLEVTAPKFLRTWDWAGRWAVVVLRPGELPAEAEPAAYLSSVADFERVTGADAAQPAYEAALRRWPADPRVHLALGNAAHATGELDGAARHYRDGLAQAPADPVLGNNYASVLGELGCRVEARAALDAAFRASGEQGRWNAQLGATASELAASTAMRSAACDAFAER